MYCPYTHFVFHFNSKSNIAACLLHNKYSCLNLTLEFPVYRNKLLIISVLKVTRREDEETMNFLTKTDFILEEVVNICCTTDVADSGPNLVQ